MMTTLRILFALAVVGAALAGCSGEAGSTGGSDAAMGAGKPPPKVSEEARKSGSIPSFDNVK